jgi:hypothetical protein
MSLRSAIRNTFVLPARRPSFSVQAPVDPTELATGGTATHSTKAINLSTVSYEVFMEAQCANEIEYDPYGVRYSDSKVVNAGTIDPIEIIEDVV